MSAEGRDPAPLLSWRGALLSLAAALLLCWPMLLTTAPLGYSDMVSYYRAGANTFALVAEMVAPAAEPAASGTATGDSGGGGGGGARDEAGSVTALRSFVYAFYFYITAQTPAGIAGAVLLQSAATIFMALAFVRGPLVRPSAATWAAMALLAFGSTLPWFVSYAMPDILAAAVLLWAALLMRRIDEISWLSALIMAAITGFAILAHYGHFPLAGALVAAVLAWRLVARRLTAKAVLVGVLPVALATLTNLGGSTVVQDTPSVTPKRLPLLLARSLEDGPARWYLQDACPQADWAICELFPEIPDNITTFLWDPGGMQTATPGQMQRVRDEELPILWESFRRYPLAQSAALGGNAALQVVAVGTGQLVPVERVEGGDGFTVARRVSQPTPVLDAFDWVLPLATLAGIAALGILAVRKGLEKREWEVVGVVVAGLLINAAIFGGLSAPVDRYQSRLIWLLPAFLAIFLWQRDAEGRRDAVFSPYSARQEPSPH